MTTDNTQPEEEKVVDEIKPESQNSFSNLWDKFSKKAKEVAQNIENTTKEIVNKPEVKDFTNNLKKQTAEIKQKIDSGELEQNLRSGLDQAGKSVGQVVETAKTTVNQTSTTIAAKTLEWRKQQAVGKFLTIDIKNIDGVTLAKRGDVITRDIINRAEAQNLLESVLEYNQSEHPGII